MCTSDETLPRNIRVRIEVPKGSHIKRGSDGRIDFVSPLPCPWNYGSAIETSGPDGDPVDVVVLGDRLERNQEVHIEVRGRVPFLDDGVVDDKWVAAQEPLRAEEIAALERFFERYARVKRLHGRLCFRRGETRAGAYRTWSENGRNRTSHPEIDSKPINVPSDTKNPMDRDRPEES